MSTRLTRAERERLVEDARRYINGIGYASHAHKALDRLAADATAWEEEARQLREVWLPCDQTMQCAFCGWTGWHDDEGPHSWECPIGYRDAWHAHEMANAEAERDALRAEVARLKGKLL